MLNDKPQAAFQFKDDIDQLIQAIPEFPQKHRKSIYFDHEDFRDLIYKGYTVTFKIDQDQEAIDILSLTKHQER